MPTKPKQNNTLLIILIAVAGVVALLLLLDAFLPILPDSIDRPDAHEPTSDSTDAVGAETKKHWWEGIFDKKEPEESETADGTADNTESETRPYPTESVYYTSTEMTEAYLPYLRDAFRTLGEMEDTGVLPPIDRVGLFNIDLHGMPEIILRHKTEGCYRYVALELISLETVVSWDGDAGETEELQIYVQDEDYTVLLSTCGNGDDRYIWEMEYDGKVRLAERISMVREGAKTTFYVNGVKTDESAYSHTYGILIRDGEMPLTALKMLTWQGNEDPDAQANHILSTGQKFIRNDKTLP